MTRISTLPEATDSPRANLAEQAYSRLKAELHDFLWVAGDRFSEAEVAQRLGVSRTPVREALFRLRNEGFIEVESKSGWFVKPIDFDRIEQLYDLRIVLELASVARLGRRSERCGEGRPEGHTTAPDGAAAGGAEEATVPTALAELKAAWLVPAAERLADGRAVGVLDEQFHASLVRAAGNAELARVHQEVTDRIRIVRRLDFTRADRIAATYDEHAQILRAVLQRKTEAAQLLLKSHIEQSKNEVRKITLHSLHEARGRRGRA